MNTPGIGQKTQYIHGRTIKFEADFLFVAEAGHKPGESIVCVGKIKHAGSQYVDDWNYLKKLLPAEAVKGMLLDTIFT